MLFRIKHTAGLTLPSFSGFPMGIHLAPGDNEVPDDYGNAVMLNPSVMAWVDGGLLDIVETSKKRKPKSDPLPPPPVIDPPKSDDPIS